MSDAECRKKHAPHMIPYARPFLLMNQPSRHLPKFNHSLAADSIDHAPSDHKPYSHHSRRIHQSSSNGIHDSLRRNELICSRRERATCQAETKQRQAEHAAETLKGGPAEDDGEDYGGVDLRRDHSLVEKFLGMAAGTSRRWTYCT